MLLVCGEGGGEGESGALLKGEGEGGRGREGGGGAEWGRGGDGVGYRAVSTDLQLSDHFLQQIRQTKEHDNVLLGSTTVTFFFVKSTRNCVNLVFFPALQG